MAYYNICDNCGAHLDPGEKCDCVDQKEERNFSSKNLKSINHTMRSSLERMVIDERFGKK